MARTVFYTATTLDGFLADERDDLGWLLKQPLEEHGAFDYADFIRDVGALVMGSTTYEWVLRHHVDAGETWAYDQPAWVMTTRDLRVAEGADVRFARGDVRELHPHLRAAAGDKDVWVVGGGDLAGQYADAGLLDEVIVSIAPVTLGAGRPLLPRRLDLELLETGRNAGFVCARYRVVGPLTDNAPHDAGAHG